MKLQSYAIAALSAAVTTVCANPVAQAIVAVDQDVLNQSLVAPGAFSGVVRLFESGASSSFCTGSLLSGGQYILTAAHCLRSKKPFEDIFTERQPSFVSFNLANGFTDVSISNSVLFPEWDGIVGNGNDIAILSLAELAPSEAEQYDIYRNTDEVGQTFTKVGYGYTGTGTTGAINPGGLFAYSGQNQFEATETFLKSLPDPFYTSVDPAPLSRLLYDFDNGYSNRNLFGSLGLGNNEVDIAPGDSGGAAFIGNLIAGISSYGATSLELDPPTDIDFSVDSSFGEFAGDTRVSTYVSFVDSIVGKTTPPIPPVEEPKPIPEPSTLLGVMISGICLWKWQRGKKVGCDRNV
jgi:secreted trypsin-like serine protease